MVTTDYGPFIAPSDVRLRRLLREIAAIAQLQAMQQSEAFEKAAIEAGKSHPYGCFLFEAAEKKSWPATSDQHGGFAREGQPPLRQRRLRQPVLS